jgi:hypothetical protein
MITPGPAARGRSEKERAELAVDAERMANVDRKYYWGRRLHSTDSDGRATLSDLISGVLYRISDHSDRAKGEQVRKDFTVKPGETLYLGDIRIERPQS